MKIEKRHKRIIENIFSLGIISGLNILIPLVTLPYLIRTVGIDNYGAYAIVYAMIHYGILFSSYGFSYSTTQQIAQNRDNKEVINHIVHATLTARILIMLIISLIMGIVCIIVYPIQYFIMYLWGLGMIIGDILNPIWLYQGMEKMRFMTIVNLISKSVFTALIFIFIRKESDYPYITLLNSIGYIIAGSVSLIMAYRYFDLHPLIPKRCHIIHQFKSGWYIFLSTISMTLYRNSNVFILGFFLPSGLVGIYDGAEKVIKAFQVIINPVSSALFPHIARSFKNRSFSLQWQTIKRLSKIMSILLILLSGIAFFTAPLANRILLDNQETGAIELIRIMTPVIFFGGLNYILGIVGLVNAGEKKSFFHCVMTSGISSILLLLILVKPFGLYSGGIAMVICELSLFIMCMCVWKRKINSIHSKNITSYE